MTNLKITCDGERLYLEMDDAEPFLLGADGRGDRVDALRGRLRTARAIWLAGGTCEILLGEVDEG